MEKYITRRCPYAAKLLQQIFDLKDIVAGHLVFYRLLNRDARLLIRP